MRFLILPIVIFSFLIDAGKISSPVIIPLTDTAKTATDSILDYWLSKQVVENNSPTFNSLWLFVSTKELDSIETSKSLFRKLDLESNLVNDYYSTLTLPEYDKHPIANVLRTSNNLRLRDAWPNYWTLINDSPSGNQLIQVFLEDSALIVSFFPDEKNPFRVYDRKGNAVSLPEAMKRESQIAVVFMYHHRKGRVSNQNSKSRKYNFHSRSFFIFNEKMIKHWQHASPGMQHGILKDLDYLLLLEAWFKENSKRAYSAGKWGKNVVASWNKPDRNRSIQEKVFSSWRFSSEIILDKYYVQSSIKSIREMWSLQKKPVEKFPSLGNR